MGQGELIGITCDGQLGRMIAMKAKKLGLRTKVLGMNPNGPAAKVADIFTLGSHLDEESVLTLGRSVDLLTFEIENVHNKALRTLESEGRRVEPSAATLKVVSDKLAQKYLLKKSGLPQAAFLPVLKENGVREAGRILGYPLMLKARKGAYDGRGNEVIKDESDVPRAFAALDGNGKNRGNLYVEEFVNKSAELAVGIARSTTGEVRAYPVVETVQKDSICHQVFAPAPFPQVILNAANDLAHEVLQCFTGAGMFGIELFLTDRGEVLVNEVAPRVHNSYHWTMEGAVTCQFEQHLRAITGRPLGEVTMRAPYAIMTNILGEGVGPANPQGVKDAEVLWLTYVHIYGKEEVRPGRKMGHVNILGSDRELIERRADQVKKLISI